MLYSGHVSKVIQIRQLPYNAREADIRDLGAPFGKVANVQLMPSESKAFLEFQDIDSSKAMMNYYTYVAPIIRNEQVSNEFLRLMKISRRHFSPNQVGER